MIIRVTEENGLVLTHISFGNGLVHSAVSIDLNSIALLSLNGIEVYSFETQKLCYKIRWPAAFNNFALCT